MPSEWAARHIVESLAAGERQEDFEYMLDTLTRMRRAYHLQAPYDKVVETGAAKILCVLIWPKPRRYIDATQRFRILFQGVANSPVLQATFANSVLPAALIVGEDIDYDLAIKFSLPFLYFSLDPILRLGNLAGANLQGADLSRVNLQEANLLGADLSRVNLQEANLLGADLQKANLQEANLQGANLRGANLQEANLQEANLQEANLQEANLQEANLRGVHLSRANLRIANLLRANLQGASLVEANLIRAKLQGADLRGAYLFGTYLFGADLWDANLQSANLQGALLETAIGLTQEHLEQAIGDEGTVLPKYLHVPAKWN